MATSLSPLCLRLYDTAQDFAHSYDQDKAGKDIKQLSRTLTPDCRRYFAPSSFVASMPSMAAGLTNKQFEDHECPVLIDPGIFESWTVEVTDITIDEHQRKVVLRTLYKQVPKKGAKVEFDSMFTLRMTYDGEKIWEIVEYMDTACCAAFIKEQNVLKEQLEKGVDGVIT